MSDYEDKEPSNARSCNCGRKGGCDWEIDECYEQGMDEDALPCANIGGGD